MAGDTREHWHSGVGFFLAALGSAVGLGNVWRFSYVAGENGGGAFLLVYLLVVLLVGVPLLLGEFALGRSTQRESATAVATLLPARWHHVGLLGVVASALILAYYAVIAGWVFKYLGLYLFSSTHELASRSFATSFAAHLAQPLEPLAWQFLALALTAAVIARGVEKGIERISLVLMPALALLLLGLAVHSATLPGHSQALAFLFRPDWSALLRPEVYLAALGQAFFSIGLAMGVMMTYGSYQSDGRRLPGMALAIVAGDTLFALTTGLVIFPAVFSFGLDPAQGPGLAFVVLPGVFAQMTGGPFIGMAFFLLLSIAALTSMVSLLEVPTAYVLQRFGGSRRRVSLLLASLLFLLGVPASLGFGVWSELRSPGGRGILDGMDFLAVELLLPINGLLLALLLGWLWPRHTALAAADLERSRLGRLWHAGLRYLVPLLVAAVLAGSMSHL